ncbi:terminase [Lactococcus phage GE1]|uniref:Terminase n=1 Tax=Lactococcus phage GE1 TaxID=1698369 RepID=A0A0N6WMQ5_9CAUD|nr:terminase [Lactococcus phage GE1]ALA06994.1 terminase [Lactococcus phage GE1]
MKYNNPNIAIYDKMMLSEANKKTLAKLKRFDKSPQGQTFNAEKWEKILRYINTQIPLPNGDYAETLDYMKLPLSMIFCYDFPIREIFLGVGRSNYKSGFGTICAEIFLLLGGRPSQAMKFMAVSKDVALSEMFGHLQLSLSSGVASKQKININKDNVEIPINSKLPTRGSKVVIRGADENRLDGGREQLVVVDELGAMKKSPLGTLRQGLAKNEGLLLVTTTNNLIRNGAYDSEMKLFRSYLEGDDYSRWSFIFELDTASEALNPKYWYKSNPAMGIAVKQEDIQQDLNDARVDPSKMAVYLSKRHNLDANGTNKYFAPDEVKQAQIPSFDFKGLYGVLGTDFAVSGDTWGSVFLAMVGQHFYALPIAIRPEGIDDPYKHIGGTHYHDAKRNDSTEGVTKLAEVIRENELNIVKVGYDNRFASKFFSIFEEVGMYYDKEQVAQNSFKISGTVESVKRHLQGGTLHYTGGIMRVHLLNATVAVRPMSTDVRLVKSEKDGKIDLADALTDALYVYEENYTDYQLYGQENLNILRSRGVQIDDEGKLI